MEPLEQLNIADHRIKRARDSIDENYEAQLTKLARKGNGLKDRLTELNEKKDKIAKANGNENAAEDDLVEINAGGKIVAAKRSTLTQLKGTRFEALFSGRWDEQLQRDSAGRIFVDVNSVCFEAIVDYLNEMAISSEDNPPSPPSVDDEHKHILQHQLELFGLLDRKSTMEIPDIVKDVGHVTQLHDWLKEDGSDGELSLLYRSSRDGADGAAFHSKCDNKGCTLTVIETTDGYVLGGYSNTPWLGNRGYHAANKAFLFVLSGNDIASPCKMKLKNANDGNAVYLHSDFGPTFGDGNDLYVHGTNSHVYLKFGKTYESGPLQLDNNGAHKVLAIKEMEVFEVSGTSSRPSIATSKEKQIQHRIPQAKPVTMFSEGVNEAINAKQESLVRAESEILKLEDGFEDEHHFIVTFASGHTKDVVLLNASGTVMAAKRSTLQAAEDSVLAQQFDDSKWTEQGRNASPAKDWTPSDVFCWAQSIDNISDDDANVFVQNEIAGNELLALGKDGLTALGINRTGTLFLLLKEIKELEMDVPTFIQHSAYCFGKILDYLRLKQLHSQGLVEEPALPVVCDSQKSRFEKVVKYYFPGDGAKFILG